MDMAIYYSAVLMLWSIGDDQTDAKNCPIISIFSNLQFFY